ncbi:MAG: ABC transporter ATP-binding protein [Granulosicoccus sp.]
MANDSTSGLLSQSSTIAASLSDQPTLECVGLGKSFGTVVALQDVSLRLRAGQVHALLGENGAGKSTLAKCMMGFHRPDTGQIAVRGRQTDVSSPEVAQSLGLGMVYQHFTLVPSMTGLENLVVSQRRRRWWINWRQEFKQLRDQLAQLPFSIDLERPVHSLSSGEKQKLEIIKQLVFGCRVLLLDEPTSVLTRQEADELLGLLKQLCQQKALSVLMITHKLREVRTWADQVHVLRRGRCVGGGQTNTFTDDDLARLMVEGDTAPGNDPKTAFRNMVQLPASKPEFGTGKARSTALSTVLSVEQLAALRDNGKPLTVQSLQILTGQIIGIAGVSGNGQSEFMQCLGGLRSYTGTVKVCDKKFIPDRQSMQRFGVRYLPEEPLHSACAAEMTVSQNLAFRDFDVHSLDADSSSDLPRRRFGLPGTMSLHRAARQQITDYDIRPSDPEQRLGQLSGGNVQRVALAREFGGNCRLLIVSNPCFGLDISAVAATHTRLAEARASGTAVLLFSEDLDELMTLSDSLHVMFDGQLSKAIVTEKADAHRIGQLMAGNNDHSHLPDHNCRKGSVHPVTRVDSVDQMPDVDNNHLDNQYIRNEAKK